MPTAADDMKIDAASQVWVELSARVERFVEAWEAAQDPPAISAYLTDLTPAVRRMTAIELIKVDLEYRWVRVRLPRRIEEYLAEFPFLNEDIPVDLLYEEYHVRRQSGETVVPGDSLFRRFPEQAEELQRLIGAGVALKSTTLVKPGPRKGLGLVAGETVDDFDLIAKLGEGAFGDVFLARQRSMQRIVALKVTADRGSEPQTLAQLDHEHIVRVYDQRRLPERGIRLMYMQYAAGGTLDAVIERLRPIPPNERTGADYIRAVDAVVHKRGEEPPHESLLRNRLAAMAWPEVICWLAAQLSRALDYAHHVGVLHRDVKPANVLLTAEGSPKLADFNISFSSKLDGATPAAYFGGSLAYMSPEQLEACNPAHDRTPEELDGRSDLYSLGVMLWELLTGLRPFDDEQMERSWGLTLAQMTDRRRRGAPTHLLERLVRDKAPGLHLVFARCLASDVEGRFSSGTEMARHFDLCLLPQTQRLLMPRDDRWHSFVCRHPILTIVGLTLLPNGVAGALNYLYNKQEIILKLPNAEAVFEQVQTIINLVFFPLGAMYGAYRVSTIAKFLSNAKARDGLDDNGAADLRRRCLFIGHEASMIGVSMWVVAGVLYPIGMHLGLGDVPMTVYMHFFTSLLLCGSIAAAYPFLLITFVSLHHYYPAFVRLESMSSVDRTHLERMRRFAWTYLGLAALVPMLSVATLALIGSRLQLALVIMAVGGIIGFLAALVGLRVFQADYEALVVTTRKGQIRKPATFDETLR
ncbi:MAG: serine/threonine protein kinase [Planctomycetia bacterium]|nr:serine/threonine protein kinase [Planctomycetia bacterium]